MRAVLQFVETVGELVTAMILTVLLLCWWTGNPPFSINIKTPIFIPWQPPLDMPEDVANEREV